MGKVRIHLKDVLIIVANSPFKPMDIGRTQPLFTLTHFQKESAGILCLQLPDDVRSAIRGAIVDYQYMKTLIQQKNCFHDVGNVVLFVVRRYDDYLFQIAGSSV